MDPIQICSFRWFQEGFSLEEGMSYQKNKQEHVGTKQPHQPFQGQSTSSVVRRKDESHLQAARNCLSIFGMAPVGCGKPVPPGSMGLGNVMSSRVLCRAGVRYKFDHLRLVLSSLAAFAESVRVRDGDMEVSNGFHK